MEIILKWVLSISLLLFLLPNMSTSEEEPVKAVLIDFLHKLSIENKNIDSDLLWNTSTDPCTGGWIGVYCDKHNITVQKIVLEGLHLDGYIHLSRLCAERPITVLSLKQNNLQGGLPDDIGGCKRLTQLFLGGNRLSGPLPSSLSSLNNLKRLDISDNMFSGPLPPDLSKISGLITFSAQNNNLNGSIPGFDFENFDDFNVSYNDFSGPIPEGGGQLSYMSFVGNPGLCGEPLKNACPPPMTQSSSKKKMKMLGRLLILLSGYIVLGLVLLCFVVFKLIKRRKANNTPEKLVGGAPERRSSGSSSSATKSTIEGGGHSSVTKSTIEGGPSRSEYSIATTTENSSLVVLQNPSMNVRKTLRFEDLLKAPAELMGRGRFGSLYKVMLEDGRTMVVKRIKGWGIEREEFEKRMGRLDEVRHRGVLPALAFYCSKQEKLLVYQYQPNGSLFSLLHGNQNGQAFNWASRLNVASNIASALAHMHKELQLDGIAHGNLKSSNILMDHHMDPLITEYGLAPTIITTNQNLPNTFESDVYSLGVVLLELLTGKTVQNNGPELARWVQSVVQEEWTVEVFDKVLVLDGSSEDRMVHLLRIALKCIDPAPEARPRAGEVAAMIECVKEDEERSLVSDTSLVGE
ncbi:putative inactive receptor kinase [Acorus calamus]|uniref:Inactive receptor kinase n=1 Tax=Acorus calamus TaxID=4465 RepID=A0AAV9CYA5_ACOCL|nr:putative inactive receptor kinase [Acorus calamus]